MGFIFCFILLIAGSALGERFVSPGPGVLNPSFPNPVYPVGSKFYIAWEDTNATRPVSIVLFQMDGKDLVYPFEYIEQRLTGRQSTDWVVATTKDLSFSNIFLLNMFYDGDSSPAAVSQKFNITDTRSVSTTTSTSSIFPPTSASSSLPVTSATNPTSLPTSDTTSLPVAGPTNAATESTSKEEPSGGLSTTAKVVIGVAIPVVVLIGIGAGYFIKGYMTRKQQFAPAWGPGQDRPPFEYKPSLGPIPGHSYELDYYNQVSQVQHQGRGDGILHELYSEPARR